MGRLVAIRGVLLLLAAASAVAQTATTATTGDPTTATTGDPTTATTGDPTTATTGDPTTATTGDPTTATTGDPTTATTGDPTTATTGDPTTATTGDPTTATTGDPTTATTGDPTTATTGDPTTATTGDPTTATTGDPTTATTGDPTTATTGDSTTTAAATTGTTPVTPGEAETILGQTNTKNNLEAAIGLNITSISFPSPATASNLDVVITIDADFNATNLTALGTLIRRSIIDETGIDSSQLGQITFTEGSIIASFTIVPFGAPASTATTAGEGESSPAVSDSSFLLGFPFIQVVIAGAVVLCLLILLVAIVIIVIVRRRSPKSDKEKGGGKDYYTGTINGGMMDSDMPLLEGTIIGKLINVGCIGETYIGEWDPFRDGQDHTYGADKRDIVAKQVDKTIWDKLDGDGKKSVLRKSTMVRHGNVVQVMGSVRLSVGYGSSFYVIAEHCPRGSLFDLLHAPSAAKQRKELVESERASLCVDIARGMRCLARHHIHHGNLNPRNVMLYLKIGELFAKVDDFSFVGMGPDNQPGGWKAIEHKERMRWAAPECLDPDQAKKVTRRGGPWNTEAADVFAFAMVVWEIFSDEGAIPYADIVPAPNLAPKLKKIDKGRGQQTQSFFLAGEDLASLQAAAEAADRLGAEDGDPYSDLYIAIVTMSTRPERPQMLKNNAVWDLLVKCWSPKPEKRPTFEEILDTLQEEFDVMLESGMSSSDEDVSYESSDDGKGQTAPRPSSFFGLAEDGDSESSASFSASSSDGYGQRSPSARVESLSGLSSSGETDDTDPPPPPF